MNLALVMFLVPAIFLIVGCTSGASAPAEDTSAKCTVTVKLSQISDALSELEDLKTKADDAGSDNFGEMRSALEEISSKLDEIHDDLEQKEIEVGCP